MADNGSAVANDSGSVAVNNSDNSINDSGNFSLELTIGDVQLNATELSASTSNVKLGTIPDAGAVNTGNINNQSVTDNRGLTISNTNSGAGIFQNSQTVNVGTVNLTP
jgi:hypothetical protein